MKQKTNIKALLFDLDGVLMDTEHGYTEFWDRMGEKYLGLRNFCTLIKGQTLNQIIGHYFDERMQDLPEIVAALDDFEMNMPYSFIPGADEFLKGCRAAGLKCAVVTSSNDKKMSCLYRAHPDFKDRFDFILTSEDFSKSKPDPECFIKGMEKMGVQPENTIVFEDSIHGLSAGRSSGAFVVGLTTSNPEDVVKRLADIVIDDFEGHTIEEIMENLPSRA
ncbi:MAG: HAD family hydrolase [Candidatus Cryptobacteroides sp.]